MHMDFNGDAMRARHAELVAEAERVRRYREALDDPRGTPSPTLISRIWRAVARRPRVPAVIVPQGAPELP